MKPPEPLEHNSSMSKKRYKSNELDTKRCNALKDDFAEFIQKRNLGQYVKKDKEHKQSRFVRKGKAIVNEVQEASKDNDSDLDLMAMVGFCSYHVEGGEIGKTMNKKWKKIMNVAPLR